MLDILVGAFLVSAVHPIMPDHWIPLVLISKAEQWSQTETLWISTLITIPHIISTIILGVLVGLIGFQISSIHESILEILAPMMFILIGLFYVYRSIRTRSHHHFDLSSANLNDRSKKNIILFMATALFFSPCIPIGSYFFIVGAKGFSSLIIVSAIYFSVTLTIMLLMVFLGRKGVERIKWHFLEHHEN